MILSHEHKFIFLRTKKTAGTSIELALSELCGPDDVITPLTREDEARRAGRRGAQNWRLHSWWKSPRLLKSAWFKFSAKDYGFYNHMKAAEMRAHIDPAVWRSYFKFAFERNPWDRQVSLYYHRYREENERPDFATFIHKDKKAHINNFGVYSIDGDLAVDFLGRFETLDQDLRFALDQVGLSTAESLPDAKTRFRPGSVPYRDHYDEETRNIVADWYAPEIKLLGYEF
ncbi:MAG TPA: sulfotransferase family 2 domain-containing protein [Methyloceanibacter sp.]|nr:sulfotransferase family 2 domain-containing protein [Methyloceanibacter sp.]